jgi:adenosylcobinamide kinase/adenosylcobinamide-phosphate guanylyltransferase
MVAITLITGGARSGKSNFARQLAEQRSDRPVYLATARIWDEDFASRVKRHQAERGSHWQTAEEEKYLSKLPLDGRTVVLDCITLWITNFFFDRQGDVDRALEEVKKEWGMFVSGPDRKDLIVVSNEVGMGVHQENELCRKFADLQGWVNQFIAAQAEEVYLMVAGIPLKIK